MLACLVCPFGVCITVHTCPLYCICASPLQHTIDWWLPYYGLYLVGFSSLLFTTHQGSPITFTILLVKHIWFVMLLQELQPCLPANEYEEHLLRTVQRKQMHHCRFECGGCRENGRPCKRLFPYCTNRAGTCFNEDTQRYDYFRFSEHHDQYIVPYHPQVLALWQAHMNIQVCYTA